MSAQFLAFFTIGSIALMMWPATIPAQQSGAGGGAGIGLKPTADGRILIERVAPDGPAAKAGILPGDWLVGVDRRAVAELNGSQLVEAIRGPVGSKVVLVYVRGNAAPVSATVTRASLGAAPGEPSAQPSILPPVSPAGPVQKPIAVAAAAKGTMRFTQQTIKDPAANNVSAITFLLPQGWQFQGQIVWLHQFSVLANLRLRLWDTKTSTTIEWLPTQHFSYTDQLPGLLQPGANWMGAIVAAPVTDPIQFVESFWTPQALPHLRNRRPTAREDFPGIARQAIANDRGWQAQAVRLRYAFERQDQPWEQDVCFTLAYAPVNAGVAMWNVQRAYTCFAPKGGLDARASHIKAVIANVNFTPEWLATYSVVKQLQRQGLQQQMADTAAFGRKLQDYTAHIRQLGQQMHEERMKSFDRIAESQREYLGGVETYNDPYQRQAVYMPAGYKEYWVNQKGEVFLSEQAGYNPNVGDVNDWRKMERRDPMRQ
jgi:hypothetical protein